MNLIIIVKKNSKNKISYEKIIFLFWNEQTFLLNLPCQDQLKYLCNVTGKLSG